MKKATRTKVHAMMAHLLEHGPECAIVGICHNPYPAALGTLNHDEEHELKHLMTQWPECSGCSSFPVPTYSTRRRDPGIYYCNSNNLWNKRTKYGRARWRLVAWLHEHTMP